jgi:ABC-2 type transport system ATP-binding protein
MSETRPTRTSMRSAEPVADSQRQILIAEDLSKRYGNRFALRGLTFSLSAGRVLGFLGPNGAGKTTSIRILTTIMEPSSGRFVVDGITSDDPQSIRRKIGVLPESLGFAKTNTAIEHLTYYGQLYGRSAKDARTRALALLEEVGLQQRGKSLVGTYSRGMRQRLGIARTLVNDPAVVFLDEPTLGLDPRGQKELLALVRRIPRERNASIVLCSHLLSEIEGVCDDVVILSSGQVVASGTVTEVIRQARNVIQSSGIRVHVPTASVARARQILEAMPAIQQLAPVPGMAGWLSIEMVDSVRDGSPAENHPNNAILDGLIRAGIPILSFQAEVSRLQDAFLHLTEEAIK